MKLKYYLRGLGTGVFVTALILGIALSHGKGIMSDEEVKKRAAELGMVEEFKSLAEASEEKETGSWLVSGNDVVDSSVEQDSETANKTEESKQSEAVKETEEFNQSETANKTEESKQSEAVKETEEFNQSETANKTQESKQSEAVKETEEPKQSEIENKTESSAKPVDTTIIILEVNSGDGSMTVAKRAESTGLVTSAAEFDKFLCSGGYDKKICTGKHKIPSGATMEQIAKLLISKP
ncbi:MAG: hypothetical protein IJN92_02550 [Lachnospiraceae bacterium]|nr:hypothetical protein [Lachnospiraceae bacterium]